MLATPKNIYSRLYGGHRAFAQWMASNRLKLNPAKTHFMRCVSRRQHQLSKDHVIFGGSAIQSSSTVLDLGVM